MKIDENWFLGLSGEKYNNAHIICVFPMVMEDRFESVPEYLLGPKDPLKVIHVKKDESTNISHYPIVLLKDVVVSTHHYKISSFYRDIKNAIVYFRQEKPQPKDGLIFFASHTRWAFEGVINPKGTDDQVVFWGCRPFSIGELKQIKEEMEKFYPMEVL